MVGESDGRDVGNPPVKRERRGSREAAASSFCFVRSLPGLTEGGLIIVPEPGPL